MPLVTSRTVPCLLFVIISFFFTLSLSYSCTFTVTNNCPYTIWPGTLAGSGTPQLPTTGFQLDSGRSLRIPSVPGWSGRLWARTGCTFDKSGAGKCQTGDCGGRLECAGNGASPPTSLFEITLGKGTDQDFYDVSLVDGYNLPLIAVPRGVHGACNATGCASDVNTGCPKELQVVAGEGGAGGGVVACKSACEAFGSDQYCCSGEFANPTTCRPSFYSTIFKRACPRAYSYAFDDGTSTFTCKAYDYTIVFCPVNDMRNSGGPLAPPTIQEAPPAIQEAPPAIQEPPPAIQEPSPAIQVPPPTIQEPTPAIQQAPPAIQQAPPAIQEPPPAIQEPPPAIQVPPPTIQQPPQAIQQPPPAIKEPPPTIQEPPPAIQEPRPPAIQGPPRSEEYLGTVSSSSMLLPVPMAFMFLILNLIS